MNVLSLFDGVSSGLNALQRAGVPVTTYFAAEIDKYADSVSRFNHRDAVRLGCVIKVREMLEAGLDLKIDLLIGGSPCQNLSAAGNGTGLDGEKSSLFYEFVKIRDILKARNPNLLFMLENVIPRKKIWTEEMSKHMGVEPVRINANLVSAQNRDRYYWCNWPVSIPEQRGLLLRDIIESGAVDREKSYCIDANYFKGGSLDNYLKKSRRQIVLSPDSPVQVGLASDIKGHDYNRRVYSLDGKSPCLNTGSGGNLEPKVAFHSDEKRLMVREDSSQKLQARIIDKNLKSLEDKSNPLMASSTRSIGGQGTQVLPCPMSDRHLKNVRELDDKSFTLLSSMHKGAQANGMSLVPEKSKTIRVGGLTSPPNSDENWASFHDGITYRKLTFYDCERLQTMHDNYTQFGLFPDGQIKEISKTQRYKMIGNGWCEEVIVHIFKAMPFTGREHPCSTQ